MVHVCSSNMLSVVTNLMEINESFFDYYKSSEWPLVLRLL